eukprot:14001480-Ditylum_brightwellii.AAC.1
MQPSKPLECSPDVDLRICRWIHVLRLQEEGSLRVDVNVSVTQRRSSSVQGGRCEVKNLNSLRNVARLESTVEAWRSSVT